MLVKYIDDTAEFPGGRLGESEVTAGEINFRIMQVAVPDGSTAEQTEQLDAAVQYGQNRRVIVIIRKAK
jgi:hypothetical protein